ncbi:MAG: FAD-dependent oxidoreductase [Nitrososphaeria archaeon]|nr:FAD-dependent oxidoreductase [Nitrososphaeria archaeon]NIN52464.1 FAD-dependent oxidoreductase [Nitrososphaeria archaeon]NIQ32970.1 FAD-dependent oxidoreductase [Nitrososphaeria archaeon]
MAKAGLVIGGGIAGMQAALDLADQGFKVYLVEEKPSIGGKMAQLDKTFPTLDCSACIMTPKMVDVGRHPNIELLTYSTVNDISGEAGDFHVKVVKKPRYVDEEKCTGCGICSQHCPVEVLNEHDMNLGIRKAIYVPFPQAVPLIYTIDKENCIDCGLCENVCGVEAPDYDQEPREIVLDVGTIVVTTGFELDDPQKKEEYGYGLYDNVITALEFERLLSAAGPTGGHIIRPSDGKIPKRIGFIQCVCSRDINTNPYCSRFCCMYAVKEGILAKEHVPGVECTVFYMDIRAFGKGFEDFYRRGKTEFGINFVKGRPAKIIEDPNTKNLIIHVEEIASGEIVDTELDMVVLAVGVVPSKSKLELPLSIADDNFIALQNPNIDSVATSIEGVFTAGAAEGPKDIPDSVTQGSAAAMRASIILARG